MSTSNELKPPIFLIGSVRSGTTMFHHIFNLHDDVKSWFEPRTIWMYADPGRRHDRFTEDDATSRVKKYIRKRFLQFQKRNQIFRSTHGKEIRSIRDEYGNKKRDVLTTILTGAPKDKALIPEASQKRMLELMELAPDAKVYQEKAWVLLTAQQQKKFQFKYQELLDDEAKRKEANKNKDMPMDESKKRETVIPQKRMLDDAAERRINFLKKLQGLQDD